MSLKSHTTSDVKMTSSSSSSKTSKIPSFDGKPESFAVWRTRVRAEFKFRGWGAFVAYPTAPGATSATTAEQKDSGDDSVDTNSSAVSEAGAFALLVSALPDTLVAAYACDDDESPTRLWKSIVDHFQSTSLANRAHLRDRLSSARMGGGGYLAFWTEVNATSNALKAMGDTVEDSDIVYHVLKGLAPPYASIRLILQHSKGLTVREMHDALTVHAESLAFEAQTRDGGGATGGLPHDSESYYGGRTSQNHRSGGHGGQQQNRFRSGPSGACFTCGHHGHKAFECEKNRGKKKCNYCHAIDSHTEDECRKKKAITGASSSSSASAARTGKPAGPSSGSASRSQPNIHFSNRESDSEDDSNYFTALVTDGSATSSSRSYVEVASIGHALAMTKLKQIPTEGQAAAPTTMKIVADSGSSVHTCNDASLFNGDLASVKPIRVKVANDEIVTLDKAGSLRLSVDQDGRAPITLKHVYYAPQCPVNLLSIGATTKTGKVFQFHSGGASVHRAVIDRTTGGVLPGSLLMELPAVGNLYVKELYIQKSHPVRVRSDTSSTGAAYSVTNPVARSSEQEQFYRLVHNRLGHLGRSQIEKLRNSNTVSGLSALRGFDFSSLGTSLCDGCELGKANRKQFARVNSGAPVESIMDRWHSDIKGPINPATTGGNRYMLTVTDERSRRSWIFLLKHKSETAPLLVRLCREKQVETGRTLREFHSDNGTEFVNKELTEFFANQGTRPTTTTIGTPQHNGISERLNRTLFNTARAVLFHAQAPPVLWGHAAHTAVDIKNHSPTSANGGDLTPMTIWRQQTHALNELPSRSAAEIDVSQFLTSVKNFRTFGCNAYFHLQHQQPTEARAAKGIFVGYADVEKGYYRLIDLATRKVVTRRDVHCDESSFTFIREFTQDKFRPFEISTEISAPLPLAPVLAAPGPHVPIAPAQELATLVPVCPLPPQAQADASASPEERDPAEQGQVDQIAPEEQAAIAPIASQRLRIVHNRQPVLSAEYRQPASTPRAKYVKPVFDAVRASNILDEPRVRQHRLMPLMESVPEVHDAEEALSDDFEDPEPHFEPKTFAQAAQCKNAKHWMDAAAGEIQAMQTSGSYELVDRPLGANVIDSRWVFVKKLTRWGRVKRFRARLTARGFLQIFGVDHFETYAPVMRYKSLKMLLAIAATRDYEIRHLDVPKAFLLADLKETIYMEQPQGFSNGNKNQVWRLLKSIYGIKQAPNNWNGDLNAFLLTLGLTRLKTDTCIYAKASATGRLLAIGVFVDDLIPIFHREDAVEWAELLSRLVTKYNITDTGDISVVLGMCVTRDRAGYTLKLDQSTYVAKMLEEYGLTDCNPADTPTSEYILSKADCPQELVTGERPEVDQKLYQQMVGSLNYASCATRLDITYAANTLSRFLKSPGTAHMTACKRVFRYLKRTASIGLVLGGVESTGTAGTGSGSGPAAVTLTAHSDSDWGGNLDDRKSTTGYIVAMGASIVSWVSKRQAAVALSSCEAEYYALSAAVAEAQGIRQFLDELLVHDRSLGGACIATIALVDNQAAIAISANDVNHSRTKHIDIRHHFIRAAVASGELTVQYVPTMDQAADILTKGLGRVAFTRLRDRLMA